MKQIIIATKNKGKAIEFKDFFATYHINAISLLDLTESVPDVKETGTTFTENAKLKAEQNASVLKKAVLADDSGLIIDALDGRPGIYSSRYAGESADDQANIKKVLNELVEVPTEKRTARFVCVLAIVIPGEKTVFRSGFCEGLIGFSEKGTNGFGYDSIFIPKGYRKTMAQLSSEEKSKISHRRHAIIQLKDWITTYTIT